MKYYISTIKEVVANPSLVRGEIRKYGLKFNQVYHRNFHKPSFVEVMSEDWDNLIILDGCRFDTFAKINTIRGTLESRTSSGSTSWEFMEANFRGMSLHDTVYTTANPFESRLESDTFHAVLPLLNKWDPELQTVHPSTVLESAQRAIAEFPNKRHIIHFMQPHYPFIGEQGQKLDHRGFKQDQEQPELDGPNIWDVLQWGYDEYNVTEQLVQEAYRENLEVVLKYVTELLESLDGKSVISADHGNLIGDRLSPVPVRGYGHPADLRVPALVKVPWHICPFEHRRKIQTEPPLERAKRLSSEDVDERLSALGYT